MEKRKARIEELRQEIADIERDNEELERTIAELLGGLTNSLMASSTGLAGTTLFRHLRCQACSVPDPESHLPRICLSTQVSV